MFTAKVIVITAIFLLVQKFFLNFLKNKGIIKAKTGKITPVNSGLAKGPDP